MYCLIVLQFFLQHLMNAKIRISRSLHMLKPTPMISNNFVRFEVSTAVTMMIIISQKLIIIQ
jgi:hypothetical protein